MAGALRGILFDKDGVLIDHERTWDPVNRLTAREIAAGDQTLASRLLQLGGYERPDGRLLPGTVMAAGTPQDIAEVWLPHLQGWDHHTLAAEIDRIFDEASVCNVVSLTDIKDLFRTLKGRGFVLGVATNDSEAAARSSLTSLGALEHLDFLAGYDSGHGSKPGPGMALAFCKVTGLAAAEVIVVGDSTHDLEMGKRAGLGLLVAVLSGTGTRESFAGLAHHFIDDVTALQDLLDRLREG